jgi:hypothetical protein
MADKSVRLKAYFALPPAAAPYSFNRRDQLILLVAAMLFQAIYLLIIPLVVECDAAMYFDYAKSILGIEGGAYTYYRPPGFPVFLIATGQLLFDSFIGTVVAQAAMGVLIPVLVYRSLAPINRCAAFICTFVLIFSGTPFFAAKLMLAEQLFTFLLVGTVYSFSRYYFSRDPRFIYLVIFLGIASMFVRWGGLIPLLLASTTLVIIAHRETGHLRHLMLALSVIAAITGAYSFLRSQILNEPALFGSLHTSTGRQIFFRIYGGLTWSVMQWHQLLGLPEPDDKNILRGFDRHGRGDVLKLIDPTNGPATRQLHELVVTIATENPDGYRRLKPLLDQAYKWPGELVQDHYQEHFGQFDGDAKAMAENFFDHPSLFYLDYISSELNLKLGIARTDALLKKVVVEAVWAHPIILMSMVSHGMTFFGVDLKALVNRLRGSPELPRSELGLGIPVMGFWKEAHYSECDIDTTGCVASAMPQEMLAENLWDHRITCPLRESTLFTVGNTMRNLVRNAVGVIFLLTWWFIPFSRHRGFFIFIAANALALIGSFGAFAGGAYTRYEIPVQPLMLIATTGAILALLDLIRKPSAGGPTTPKPRMGV